MQRKVISFIIPVHTLFLCDILYTPLRNGSLYTMLTFYHFQSMFLSVPSGKQERSRSLDITRSQMANVRRKVFGRQASTSPSNLSHNSSCVSSEAELGSSLSLSDGKKKMKKSPTLTKGNFIETLLVILRVDFLFIFRIQFAKKCANSGNTGYNYLSKCWGFEICGDVSMTEPRANPILNTVCYRLKTKVVFQIQSYSRPACITNWLINKCLC